MDVVIPVADAPIVAQTFRVAYGNDPMPYKNLFPIFSCLNQNKLLSLQTQTVTIPMPVTVGLSEPTSGQGCSGAGCEEGRLMRPEHIHN